MLQENSGGRLTLAVSDPTQLQSAVQITLTGGNYRAAASGGHTTEAAGLGSAQESAGITVQSDNGRTRIVFNTEKSYGKTFTVELEPAE